MNDPDETDGRALYRPFRAHLDAWMQHMYGMNYER